VNDFELGNMKFNTVNLG